jgi:hypothetical protein
MTDDDANNRVLPLRTKLCSCGAPLHFIRSATTGKMVPCEVRRRTVMTSEGDLVSGYESHFAACPDAKKFRKGRDS